MLVPPISVSQGGAFTRVQALEAGISSRTIRRRIDAGTWVQWMPYGLCLTGVDPTLTGRACVAAMLTNGVASHTTAAELLGMGTWPSGALHITTPRRRHEAIGAVTEHRMTLELNQIVKVGGVPVTDRTTTILDLVSWLPERDARAFFFRCIQQGWITPDGFSAGIARRPGRHGIQRLRTFLAYLGTNAHSGGEHELHLVLKRGGIEFTANVPLRLSNGSTYYADVLVKGTRLVIELDGRRFHSDERSFQNDRTRQNHLVNAGFIVLRFTVSDVVDRPGHVLQQIEAALTNPNLRSGNDCS